MASLYVDRRDVHLQHDAGAIAFYENGQRSATVPLAPITRVILRGKVTLEACWATWASTALACCS